MAKFKIEGMKKLQRDLKKLGDVPQRTVTAAARKGMNIASKDAKVKAPVQTGDLKKGIKLVGERTRTKGKKVYRVVFDRSMNDVFQKRNSLGDITGYYPVSQEYGFFTKNGKYIPGFYFIRDSLSNNKRKIEDTIVNEMSKRIDKELRG
ncbi:HK97 gp10 family phage protein [Lederbergia wuyishanensis]|uniref:HK97 gp10 family phage protein n=1 Tax=Lederbergia wuyishanensis TaxID=1347903 RepID=A0ABU0D4F5_9BACI|nr:HK97 gp10 family phage protein [Lederbergia wuyishanensis]MCJ8008117.1 HK97 gp10 family phage protein [Lederbergia wuyishanensis]MDQ0343297.1 HK97 gp10 family phage protein [Lederbergia wuyishanensis]